MPARVKISKFLSLVLRHRPETIGICLDQNGWIVIVDLIEKARKIGITLTPGLIQHIVATSDKQRFTISADGSRIRASQGHTLSVNPGLVEAEPPEILYHGTARSNLGAIRREGIKRGKRNHVHLSCNKETATKVGARHGFPIVLTVLALNMYRDGITFFQSENGIWLTEFVAPEYVQSDMS